MHFGNATSRKKPGRTKPDKLDEQALLEDVRRYPDKLLRERAEDFSMSINGIWVALKRLGIKKTLKYSKRCHEKRTTYLRQLREKVKLSGSDSIVYLDESVFNSGVYRPQGWGVEGQRVYGDCSGKRCLRRIFCVIGVTHPERLLNN